MADSLGTAWLDVVPSFKGVGAKIKAEMGGLDSAVTTQANGWGSKIKASLGGAFKAAGVLAIAGLGAATAFIGSYTSEALAASDATDKFKSTLNFAGIDVSTISQLTKSAQAYADKTVYDLSDIQQITAQLASNGVKGFDKLAEAAGNLNAVAGGNKETFKSVGLVITQTAGAGKLMTENWRQLTDAIPGAAGPLKQALADAGAYTGDFQKAMEKGEISAEEFNAAITSLGFKDAAMEAATSTKTFEGAWGNFEAAITGGLVKIIEPLKGPLTQGLSAAADKASAFFGAISSGITGVVEILAKGDFNPASWGDGVEEDSPIIDFWFDLREAASGALKGIQPIIGGLAGMLGPLLSGLPGIGGAFSSLTGPVGVVIGLFTQMISNSPELRTAFGTVFATIGNVANQLAPILTQIMTVLGQVLGQVGDQLAPILGVLATMLGNMIGQLLPQLMPIITTILGVIQQLVPPIMQVVQIIAGQLMALLPSIMPILTELISLVMQIVQAVAPLIVQIGQMLIPIVQSLMPIVQTVFGVITEVISSAMTTIQGVIDVVLGVISGDWLRVWDGIKGIVSGVWGAITGLISGAVDIIKSVISGALGVIKTLWSSAWTALSTIVSGMWSTITGAVSSGVENAVSFVRGLPGKIKDIFSGAGSWLLDAGRKIISGFIDGITSMFGKVKEKLGQLTSWLPDWKGPAERDEVILKPAGQLVIGGFREGLESQYGAVKKSLAGFTADLAGSSKINANITGVPAGQAGVGGNTTINIHVDMAQLASVRTVEDLLANIGRWSVQA